MRKKAGKGRTGFCFVGFGVLHVYNCIYIYVMYLHIIYLCVCFRIHLFFFFKHADSSIFGLSSPLRDIPFLCISSISMNEWAPTAPTLHCFSKNLTEIWCPQKNQQRIDTYDLR